jgi:hypothetical protein
MQLHIYPENISIYLCTEYAHLWELQTLNYKLSAVYLTIPSKMSNYISIIRAGNKFQMQITVLPSIECNKSNENNSDPLV